MRRSMNRCSGGWRSIFMIQDFIPVFLLIIFNSTLQLSLGGWVGGLQGLSHEPNSSVITGRADPHLALHHRFHMVLSATYKTTGYTAVRGLQAVWTGLAGRLHLKCFRTVRAVRATGGLGNHRGKTGLEHDISGLALVFIGMDL